MGTGGGGWGGGGSKQLASLLHQQSGLKLTTFLEERHSLSVKTKLEQAGDKGISTF